MDGRRLCHGAGHQARNAGRRPQRFPGGPCQLGTGKVQDLGGYRGDPLNAFELDDLCTILSVYWFTQTIGSSMRLYKEAFADRDLVQPPPPHNVPHAILLPLADNPAPRAWGERNLQNIVRWTELSHGGHFMALEAPEALAHDIRAFHHQIA